MRIIKFDDVCPGIIQLSTKHEYIIVMPRTTSVSPGMELPNNVSVVMLSVDEPDIPFKCEGTD